MKDEPEPEPWSLNDSDDPLKHLKESAEKFCDNPELHNALNASRWTTRAWGELCNDLFWNDALNKVRDIADKKETTELNTQGIYLQNLNEEKRLDELDQSMKICIEAAKKMSHSERLDGFVSRWNEYDKQIKIMKEHGSGSYIGLQEKRFINMRKR